MSNLDLVYVVNLHSPVYYLNILMMNISISNISICVCVMYSDVKGRSPEIGIQEIWEKIGQQIKILDIDEL